MQEYFATLQICQVDNKIDQKRSKCSGIMAMTRLVISQQISCLFAWQFVEYLPNNNTHWEIEVWRNTLLRLVHIISIDVHPWKLTLWASEIGLFIRLVVNCQINSSIYHKQFPYLRTLCKCQLTKFFAFTGFNFYFYSQFWHLYRRYILATKTKCLPRSPREKPTRNTPILYTTVVRAPTMANFVVEKIWWWCSNAISIHQNIS